MAMRFRQSRSAFWLLLCSLVPATFPTALFARDWPAYTDVQQTALSQPSREFEVVRGINDHYNSFTRVSDDKLWGRTDYWAAPDELQRVGAGDCEDLAIAKYFALREANVDAARMRLAYGQVYRAELGRIESHIVLLYRSSAGQAWWVLDNLTEKPAPLWERGDLKLTMLFNEQQVALLHFGMTEQVIGQAQALPIWAELLQRHRLLRASLSAR